MSGPVDDLEPLTPEEIRQLGMEPTEDGWRPADPPTREDEERSTWEPQDLGPVLRGEVTEEPPSILRWGDGLCLVYAGKLHWWQGEPESGKTWLALHASAELLPAGRTVVYVDLEDSAAGVVSRLQALGVTEEEIVAGFRYLRPEERMDDRARAVVDRLLDELRPALVVVDGITELAQLHGLDPLGTRDIAELIAVALRPLKRTGAAVVALDHVPKDRESRGRWALGSQHKLAGIDGAALLFRLREPFGRGREGVAALDVAKDRPGFLRGQAGAGKSLGQMHLIPDGEAVRVEFRPAGQRTRHIVQRRILASIERVPEPASTTTIQEAVANDGGGPPVSTRTIQRHLGELEVEGLVDRMGALPGQPEYWSLVRRS